MSKHKKTRKEKIIADLRHQLYSFKTPDVAKQSFVNDSLNKKILTEKTISFPTAVSINSYAYLKHDVLKTLILTMSILAFQVIVLFILKKHLVILPGIHY